MPELLFLSVCLSSHVTDANLTTSTSYICLIPFKIGTLWCLKSHQSPLRWKRRDLQAGFSRIKTFCNTIEQDCNVSIWLLLKSDWPTAPNMTDVRILPLARKFSFVPNTPGGNQIHCFFFFFQRNKPFSPNLNAAVFVLKMKKMKVFVATGASRRLPAGDEASGGS